MLSAVMKAILLRELGGPDGSPSRRSPSRAWPRGSGRRAAGRGAQPPRRLDPQGPVRGHPVADHPGSDGAGDVTAVGDGVDRAWLGRHVVINPSLAWGNDPRAQGPAYRILGLPDNGTYAERVKVPAENLFPKPEALSWEAAAAVPLAGLTAFRALVTRARVQPGETVLITGIGGGVATMALVIARHLGAPRVVTSASDAKLSRARQLGADGGANYTPRTGASGSWPCATVVRTSSSTARDATSFRRCSTSSSRAGASSRSAPRRIAVHARVRRIFWKQVSILGSTMGTPAEFGELLALIDGRVAPVVDRVFPLAAAADAHRRMDQGDQFGKIVLDIS